MSRHPRSRPLPRVVGAVTTVLTVLIAGTVLTITLIRSHGDPNASAPKPDRPSAALKSTTHPGQPDDATAPPGIRKGQLEAELARLRAAPELTTDSPLPKIVGDATKQPDLYAAEFTRRLLTQDYRNPRQVLLSWVQGESAPTPEPLVVGLVPPELRDRWAVFSVTDATDGPTPIPTFGEWARLAEQAGTSTVRIQRVTEPMAWTNAVESGRITDPGITARIVSAEVTRTTVVDGRTRRAVTSVELGLEFEGPPTRDQWSFVGAVTYTAIPVGSS
jgi:hypothetical protein